MRQIKMLLDTQTNMMPPSEQLLLGWPPPGLSRQATRSPHPLASPALQMT